MTNHETYITQKFIDDFEKAKVCRIKRICFDTKLSVKPYNEKIDKKFKSYGLAYEYAKLLAKEEVNDLNEVPRNEFYITEKNGIIKVMSNRTGDVTHYVIEKYSRKRNFRIGVINMIKVICRDVNGNRFEIDVKEYEVDKIQEKITEDDEILFVYYNQQLIWCGLGNPIGLTVDNLTGFFA